MTEKEIIRRITDINAELQKHTNIEPLQPLVTPKGKTMKELEEYSALHKERDELYEKLDRVRKGEIDS